MPALRPGVEFLLGVAVGAMGASVRGLLAPGCRSSGVLAAHCPRALALAGCADAGFSLALLLACPTLSFLPLGAVKIALVAAITLVFRIAGLFQGDCNRL